MSESAPCVQPWYAKSREITFGRPVTSFATSRASSTASDPEEVNRIRPAHPSGPSRSSTMSFAARER